MRPVATLPKEQNAWRQALASTGSICPSNPPNSTRWTIFGVQPREGSLPTGSIRVSMTKRITWRSSFITFHPCTPCGLQVSLPMISGCHKCARTFGYLLRGFARQVIDSAAKALEFELLAGLDL